MYINLITIDLCPGQGGGGVKPSGTLEISENGVYNVYSYSSASVDVHPSTSLSETYISNGNYNITGEFNGGVITVDVPAPQFVTETLNVSANGTYNPGEGIDGYSQVVVDVPIDGWDQKSFTEEIITFINIDNSASFVASSVFNGNTNIQTVNLPYATSVGNYAFHSCLSLSQVNLPVCSYIGKYAFYYCTSLNQVRLPVCEYIDFGAFQSCTSLTQLNLPMCSYISEAAFQYCGSLSQVNLPVCSKIEYGGFSECRKLVQVSLPECGEIGYGVFKNCYSLSQISLPMCSKMGSYAFENCSSLSIITIGYSGVCSLNGSMNFTNTQITSSTGSIYVPASLVDSYKSANYWSYFSDRIFPIE